MALTKTYIKFHDRNTGHTTIMSYEYEETLRSLSQVLAEDFKDSIDRDPNRANVYYISELEITVYENGKKPTDAEILLYSVPLKNKKAP